MKYKIPLVYLFFLKASHFFESVKAFHNGVHRHRLKSHIITLREKPLDELQSSYDVSLPASLRAEAVRASLRSDRGACIDFTSKNSGRTVGVLKVTGKGTINFLNNKLSNTFNYKNLSNFEMESNERKIEKSIGTVIRAGLLTSKGRIIDKLLVPLYKSSVSSSEVEAYMITSPGHGSKQLFDRLDPFIFPLDGIKLKDMCSSEKESCTRVLTFVSTSIDVVQKCIIQNVLPVLTSCGLNDISFPSKPEECTRYLVSDASNEVLELQIMRESFLPENAVVGFTFIITEFKNAEISSVAQNIWMRCISEKNIHGPVELGALEYENLRIESGMPGYGFEMTGAMEKMKSKSADHFSSVRASKASPLELFLHDIVDTNKGCYQGQEGIAALLKNKRGLPQILYSVFFPDEDNLYEGQQDEDDYLIDSKRVENRTKLPATGDELYVLGSNGKIKVGTITSISEPGGTSMREIVGLALLKRPDAILKQMNELNIRISRDNIFDPTNQWSQPGDDISSGIIMPPPLDDIDGLEVVIGNSFTRGYIRPIPAKRLRKGENLFMVEQWSMLDNGSSSGSTTGFINPSKDVEVQKDNDFELVRNDIESNDEFEEDADLDAAIEDARLAAEEAQRKADKLEMLKRRAEETKDRRNKVKEIENTIKLDPTGSDKEHDAQRKAAKMEMLRRRAEEALARRRKNISE